MSQQEVRPRANLLSRTQGGPQPHLTNGRRKSISFTKALNVFGKPEVRPLKKVLEKPITLVLFSNPQR